MAWMTDNLDSTLTHYRLYCVDRVDQVVSSHDIHALDDNAALEFATACCKEYKISLWQGAKLVGEVEGTIA